MLITDTLFYIKLRIIKINIEKAHRCMNGVQMGITRRL